ncbi:MAG: GNAT family N-acetyltransferase [Mariprofundaceae bacterium]
MSIRFAVLDDVPVFVEMGRLFHANTRFKVYDYNPQRIAENLHAIIENPNGTHCFFVAENSRKKAVGCLIGCVESHFFSDKLVASVIHYDVLPQCRMGGSGLKLITAFRKWAENRGVFEICAGVNSGVDIDKMDSFLRKLGFELTGGNYALPLGKEK